MKKALMSVSVLALVLLVCLPGMALANVVVNFDDVATPNNQAGQLWGVLPTNYLGWTWTGEWEVADNATFKTTYNNTADWPSSPNAAYNNTGSGLVSISFPTVTNVESAYFTSWGQNDVFQSFSSRKVTLNGYLGSDLIHTMDITLSPSDMVYSSIGFAGIDKIEFVDGTSQWWLMDNLTTVPIPGAVWLLASGLVGLAGLRKRFQN